MKLTLGLAQFYPELGNVPANLIRHCEWLARAAAEAIEVVLFPELSLCGYQVQDLVAEVALPIQESEQPLQPMLESTYSTGVDALVGFVLRDQRQRYYPAAAYCSAGKMLHIHRKLYLATYSMFDEARFFATGDQIRAFDTRFGRFGALICEDFWHASPPYALWLDGADIILLQSASPSRGISEDPQFANARWIERVAQAYASLFTCFVAHVNRVGYEDGKHFGGGSFVVDPEGNVLVRGGDSAEELLKVTIDLDQIQRTRARLPLLRDERPQLLLAELKRILAHEGE
ncbi:MAG: hypothetical protein OXG09_06915 [Chloroflexi bacterium]|nr:hypothetical protein [Chloroflexota bacterium]